MDALKNIFIPVRRLNCIHQICEQFEEFVSNPMDYFEVFKTSVEESTVDVMGMAREVKLKVDPEDVIEFLQSNDKT